MKKFLLTLSIMFGYIGIILVMNGAIEKQWAFMLMFSGYFLWLFSIEEKETNEPDNNIAE